jgi:hypothetical protein
MLRPGAVGALFLLLIRVAFAAPAPVLTVDASANRHPISDDIYGMNFADGTLAKELRVPVDRWGGDATSRYNWQVDASNAGFDWFFMAGGDQTTAVPGKGADDFVQKDRTAGARSLLTIPIIPYLNSKVSWDCSYPKAMFSPQQAYNPYVHPNGDDCGNSVLVSDGTSIRLAEQQKLRTHVYNTTSIATAWMQHLVQRWDTAANGGVRFVDLDNEPSGWANTHRDVVPDPPVYGSDAGVPGIIELGIRYATAVKQVDPTIQVLGPVDFGYPVYDRAPGYLDTFKAAEATAGQRLLDYLDEHYYPASCPANTTDPGTADDQAKRLRATRSLWDPTWKDESWIGQYYPPIQLIPFFRAMIAQHYPGTKLAITEYNFGGIASMNGALAQADVLGIFGREQVDLATMWGPPGTTDPVAYSFRMYRTYDGQGHGFGDVSVHAQSADQDAVSIYAAQRSSDGALTVMLVNKTTDVAAGTVALAGFSPAGPVQVWTYGPANLGAIQQQSGPSVSGGTIQVSIPAQTLMLLVLASTVVTPDAGVGTDGGVTDAGPGSSPGGSSTSLGDVVGSCAVGSGPAIAPGTLAVLLAWFLRRPRKR